MPQAQLDRLALRERLAKQELQERLVRLGTPARLVLREPLASQEQAEREESLELRGPRVRPVLLVLWERLVQLV